MNLARYRTPLAFLLGGALLLTACKKDEETPTPTPTPVVPSNQVRVEVDITTNTTWTASNKYLIVGFINVQSGATLTIEPGTVILGDKVTKGTLIINRGARLDAAGTSSQPIVFTSAQPAGERAPGDWGGIIICGRSPINLPGGTGVVEGGVEAVFGGTDAADNSGTLSYVRIEFPGIAFTDNNEINGLTLAGVGAGTTIDHVQVSYSGDDSYEFFGGTTNSKHLIAYRGLDDDFDMDNGYIGKLQFAVSLRDPAIADQSGSNGFEHDNDASGSSASPFTAPVISNVSIFGPQATAGTIASTNYRRGAHLRRNAQSRIFNSVLAGFPAGVFIDNTTTQANAQNNDLMFRNNVLAAMGTVMGSTTGQTWDEATALTWLNTAGWNNTVYANNSDLLVSDAFNLSNPNFLPNEGSPLLNGADMTWGPLADTFFENVSYRGAFGLTDWTATWTNWDPQNTAY